MLKRKQRDALQMPRDIARALLGVIVSFDEYSHFGVYLELILHWKREIRLTVVSFGQIRFSSTMAYALQRWGGMFRRVTGIEPGRDTLEAPDDTSEEEYPDDQSRPDDRVDAEKFDISTPIGSDQEEEGEGSGGAGW